MVILERWLAGSLLSMCFYFHKSGEGFMPTPAAHTPWSPDLLHGRLIGGLGARAIDGTVEDGFRVGRLTVDLFRPAPLDLVEVEINNIRNGRSLRVWEVNLSVKGRKVARVTGLVIREGAEPPGNIYRREFDPWPDPETLPVTPHLPEGDYGEQRIASGGLGSGEFTRIWAREFGSLVKGEDNSPVVSAAISGDLAVPIANCSDQGLFYINADYTVLLARYPRGDWIGLQSDFQLHDSGIAIGGSVLFDLDGPFATSSGVSMARPPITSEVIPS